VRRAGRELTQGTILGGRFEVLEVVHRSAMSTIYRARYRTDRVETVAIKQVSVHGRPQAEQEEARRWLAREAGLLSSLDHPMLPKLIAAFSEEDEHYVVMPFLEGQTLKELVAQAGPLLYPHVLSWARALTDLLIYLHGQSPPIIHRDLKPENVLIMPDRTLMVVDLGVARPLARGVPGTAIGTPGYAAPEQYQGLADERTDLYALGATLHYVLTGYDADQDEPFRHPPVRQINPKLGPGMEALVSKLLQLVPDERPPNATVVEDYLDRFQELQQLMTAVALYSRYARRLVTRVLPMAAVGVGLLAVADMNPIGISDWLQSTLSSAVLGFVAARCFAFAGLALSIPGLAASATRNGHAQARLILPVPGRFVAFALALCYVFALPQAGHWIVLPALLALPPVLTVVGGRISSARQRRAHRSLEVVMNVRIP
jgi:tRNA A-37 threonylcarbamoyl transferase component Bud32